MSIASHILVVEDSRTQALKLRYLLEQEGYRVSVANDGARGLKKARASTPDLVISDVMMPAMDGYAMCRAMKKEEPLCRIPVILLTSLSDPEDLISGLKAKADYYITKPYDEAYLLSRIEGILTRSDLSAPEDRSESIEMEFAGGRHTVDCSRRQMLNLLMSTYENAVHQNLELIRTRDDLRTLNERLEKKVRQLSISEDRFRSLVMTIPDIVYRIDADGTFTFVNEAIKRLGYSVEEIIGSHFSRIISPADVERVSRKTVLEKYKGSVTGDGNAPKLFDERRTGPRKTTGLEVRLIPKLKNLPTQGLIEPLGEEMVTVEINSSGMYQTHPNTQQKLFIGTVGVIRDITIRKQVENSLKESEDRLKTILDFAETGIMLIDPEQHVIVEANPAAARMIGLSREEIIGAVCRENFCLREVEQCPAASMDTVIRSAEQFLINAAGKRIPVLKNIAPVSLDGKRHVLETFTDISRIKETEQKLKDARDNLEREVEERTADLRRSQAQLVQVEKIGALGTLTAGIAHELNNPMMGMLNFIEYSMKHVDEQSKVHEVLQDAERETRRCIDIVKNLLTFSRIEKEGEEKVVFMDFAVVLDRVFRLLAYRIEKENVKLIRKADPDLPPVAMKTSNVQQVFLNLVGNALDALKESRRKELRIAVARENGFAKVSVSDTGPGIAEDIVPKIFDPFFTTKPVGKGTGLGLSVCQSIVEDHGGRIACSSSAKDGTTFDVFFPIHDKVSRNVPGAPT